MNNILSGISGYFSKPLILGTFLPVVMFVFMGWLVALPLLPAWDWAVLRSLEALDTQWQVLAVSFLTVVLTGFLYNINGSLIRLYEGYPWKDLWVGKRRARKYRRLFRIAQAQWGGIPHVEYKLYQEKQKIQEEAKLQGRPPEGPDAARLAWLNDSLAALNDVKEKAGRILGVDFPGAEKLILPTRLGNVIRSFEHYPDLRYNIEAVTLWPRLVAKIDEDYAAVLDDAKTSFDFMLNCSALSMLLALGLIVAGLYYPAHLNSPGLSIIWLAEVATFWALSYLFYSLAVSRAKSWGNMVRGAFDLYRLELLKQLGFSHAPDSLKEERELWSNISRRMAFGDYDLLPPVNYAPKTPSVDFQPTYAELDIWRGVNPPQTPPADPAAAQSMAVEIRVRNAGKYEATQVFVTDALPADFAYRWDSAKVVRREPGEGGFKETAGQAVVTGTNPYRFGVGGLKPQGELVLSYQALPLKTEVKSKSQDGGGKGETSLLVFQGDLLAYKQHDDAPPAAGKADGGTPRREDSAAGPTGLESRKERRDE